MSYFNSTNGGGRITLPFRLNPMRHDDLPSVMMSNVEFLQFSEDSAPWMGYYARFRGAKVAVAPLQGVWFEIRLDTTDNLFYAFRVARNSLNLVHDPGVSMNLDELRAQTRVHDISRGNTPAPVITGFTTAPATPAVRIAPDTSRAPSRSSFNPEDSDDGTPPSRRHTFTQNTPAKPFQEETSEEQTNGRRGDRLEGNMPEAFKGDRNDTKRFLLAFDRYSFMNHDANMIKDPMKRTSLFLGLLQGKAASWGDRASAWLKKIREGEESLPFGKNVWQVTEREFKDAFTDYADADRAQQELHRHRMKEGRLDEYIADFQDLVNRAGMELNEPSTMRLFAQGLQGTLAQTCIYQDSPENFPQWVQSAQQNHRNWLKVQALKDYSPFQTRRPGSNPLTWRRNDGNRDNSNGRFQQRPPRRDPDAMDVDVIRKATTEEEKLRYRTEGRCYGCGRQGHLSRNCPDRKPRIAVASTDAPITAKVEPPKIDDRATKIRKLAEMSMTLNAEDQELLALELKKLGADFQ